VLSGGDIMDLSSDDEHAEATAELKDTLRATDVKVKSSRNQRKKINFEMRVQQAYDRGYDSGYADAKKHALDVEGQREEEQQGFMPLSQRTDGKLGDAIDAHTAECIEFHENVNEFFKLCDIFKVVPTIHDQPMDINTSVLDTQLLDTADGRMQQFTRDALLFSVCSGIVENLSEEMNASEELARNNEWARMEERRESISGAEDVDVDVDNNNSHDPFVHNNPENNIPYSSNSSMLACCTIQ
jgi:hypothetical protein